MRARRILVAMVGAVGLMAVSCGSGDEPTEPAAPASANSTTEQVETALVPCGDDKGSPFPETDGSVEARLAQARVTDAMVCALGEISDAAGYGLDNRATTFEERQGFAMIVLESCREAASGYLTWDEIIDNDVEQGAPRPAAIKLNGYLRDVYCPAVSLSEAAAPSVAAVPAGELDENGMRGIYSKIAWYDGRFEALPLSECTSRLGEFMLDEGRAYRFDDETVLCLDVPSSNRGGLDAPTWSATLAFLTPQSEESALARAQQLVPGDAVRDSRIVATNAQGPNSCLSVDFRSTLVGEQARAESRRSSDLEYVNIHLYSDRQSDLGSSSPYDELSARLTFTLLVTTTPSILPAESIEAL
ncbi:hypothetical protein [Rhodococcus qingshengii]|uniref:hypothetical protein n=1 Tax=Rhodococcus qingshengii TaxID=334542 RepID=UPI003016B3EF